ncbi:MAG: hypothetical protein E6713_06120 [Sporomusaceae bacterium]|nr:hypothetical protein [Sporomusaceae bacterium]
MSENDVVIYCGGRKQSKTEVMIACTVNENNKLKIENAELEAKLAATELELSGEHTLHKHACDMAAEYKKQRDELTAQVAVMCQALEEIKIAIVYTENIVSDVKDKYFDYDIPENTADHGGRGILSNLAAHLIGTMMEIDEVFQTTPSKAADKVNKLVVALDKLARLGGPGGGYGNSIGNEIAQDALKEWRKAK